PSRRRAVNCPHVGSSLPCHGSSGPARCPCTPPIRPVPCRAVPPPPCTWRTPECGPLGNRRAGAGRPPGLPPVLPTAHRWWRRDPPAPHPAAPLPGPRHPARTLPHAASVAVLPSLLSSSAAMAVARPQSVRRGLLVPRRAARRQI